MIGFEQLLSSINDANSLTNSAIQSAENNDWSDAQSYIQKREKQLQNLPQKYTDYSEDEQQTIRNELEKLDKANTNFLAFVNANREQVLEQKVELSKNKAAINHYLDHS